MDYYWLKTPKEGTKVFLKFCKDGLLLIKDVEEKIKYSSLYRQENQLYFQKQFWNSDSSDSEEEFQHANFTHAWLSKKIYHYPH